MKQAWTGADVAYEGRHFHARGVRFRPQPATKPHPPIWIGGNTTKAIRRAVSSAQGWAPFITLSYAKATRTASIDTMEDLTARIGLARSMADELGRTEPFDICFSAGRMVDPSQSLEERRDVLGQLADAGVTWIPLAAPGRPPRRADGGLREIASDYIGA